MRKIKFNSCVCHSKINKHKFIRDNLLSLISLCKGETLDNSNNYYADSISKLDWSECKNLERSWVQLFLPFFFEEVVKIISTMGYNEIQLYEMWFQQYLKNDTHGWHIHGQQFTGVYYLEFPEGCSKTEICSPLDFNVKRIDVEEGDIIIFPAHFVHRGLPNKNNRKTIISFNFDVITNTDTPSLNLKTLNLG